MSTRLSELRRRRPGRRLRLGVLVGLTALLAFSWSSPELQDAGAFDAPRRLENLWRFVTVEVVPPELRGDGFDPAGFARWAWALLVERGFGAALTTLAIATLAIVLAATLAALLAPLAAGNVATARPFGTGDGQPSRTRTWPWRLLRWGARAVCLLGRSVPEYLLAFLLLGLLGPESAWPAVLALALHNGGILGRLGAESFENADPGPLRTLALSGAPRRSVLVAALVPASLGRLLLYFFYRFEVCLRESTVLGMMGILSLGYWVQDARSRHYYDELVFYVGLGVVLVLLGDLASFAARRWLRGAQRG